jgi:hypothetical protein
MIKETLLSLIGNLVSLSLKVKSLPPHTLYPGPYTLFLNSATASMCFVCGNMSTGLTVTRL